MRWEGLIAASRILADLGGNAGSDDDLVSARLGKAVSAAYYAMFHALGQNNADRLVGESETDRESGAWRRTYRALEHRAAYRQLSEARLSDYSDQIRDFGTIFRELQDRRHQADYDPQSRFSRAETQNHIMKAEAAIRDFLAASIAERRELAAHVLFPSRT